MKTITGKVIALAIAVSGIIFSSDVMATCNVPTGQNTSAITSTSATLNWTAPSGGAQSYNLRYRVVNTSTWTTSTSTTVNKSITSLTAASNYEWQVQSKCSGTQTSSWTTSSTFTTLIACNTPTGLNTTSITSSGATLNWTAVSGAANYNVQYRVVGAPSWTATTSSTTSKTLTSLSASSSYEWQVQTNCGSSNLSAFSSSATFATQAPPCNVPSGLNTTGVTSTDATLNWSAVSGAVSYNLQYRVVGAPSWTTTTSSTTSKTLTSLSASSNYEWQVQTNCGSSNLSAFSSSATFATQAPTCNVPSGLSTTGITSTDATLNWTSVSGAQSYNVQYRIAGAPSWTSTTSSTNSKIITLLTPSSNYEWQVQTNCGNSNLSAFSSPSTFSTLGLPCNVPVGLTTSGITLSGATMEWADVAGAAGYEVQYRIVGALTWRTASSPAFSLSVTSLSPFTNYEWQVRTDCGSMNFSAFSASNTFTTTDINSIPLSVFHGNWLGTDQQGNQIAISLDPQWNCSFTINGVPTHAGNSVVGYRLPQYSPRQVTANGPPSGNNVTIKFFTQNAIHGVMAMAPANANAPTGNAVSANTIQQVYTATAVISDNGAGQYTMALYLDDTQFSSVPPASGASPDGSPLLPYATLIKQ